MALGCVALHYMCLVAFVYDTKYNNMIDDAQEMAIVAVYGLFKMH